MLIRSLISLAAVVYVAALRSWSRPCRPATLCPQFDQGLRVGGQCPCAGDTWEKTQLYQLFEDPVMKPFTEDLRRQLDEKWLSNYEKIGLSIEDLQTSPAAS